MIGVWTSLGEYRAAGAELPLDVTAVEAVEGSIAAVGGEPGWTDAALAALHDGAVAVVVDDPHHAPLEALDDLSATARSRAIVLSRPLVRADVVADAVGVVSDVTPTMLVVDAMAGGARERATCDAIGWVRQLSGGAVELRAAAATPTGIVALFDAAGIAATLTVTVGTFPDRLARLRVLAVGSTRVEVAVHRGAASVAVSSESGTTTLSRRFESHRRLALRRAVAAVRDDGVAATDLDDLRADTRLVEALLETSNP